MSMLWLQAIHQYQQLLLLLQGEQPRHLLPACPQGYLIARVRALAEGPCMTAFTWNSGGGWSHKPWSNELPTDSALVLYLFSAFLEVSGFLFPTLHVLQCKPDVCILCKTWCYRYVLASSKLLTCKSLLIDWTYASTLSILVKAQPCR